MVDHEYWESHIFGDIITVDKYKKYLRNGKVLDIGCGSGAACFHLGNFGFNCIGLDVSKNALKIAISKLRKNQVKKISFLIGNSVNLPFSKESFDSIICINTLHHFLKKDRAIILKEISRALNKGGILLISMFALDDPGHGYGREIENNTFLRPEKDVVVHYFDKNEIIKLFSRFNILFLKKEISYDFHENIPHMHSYWVLLCNKKYF